MASTLHRNPVQVTKSQKDVSIIVSDGLIYTENNKKRYSKGRNALCQFKPNLSEKALWTTKLNAYTAYVVTIVTYSSQAWMSNRSNMEQLENN